MNISAEFSKRKLLIYALFNKYQHIVSALQLLILSFILLDQYKLNLLLKFIQSVFILL